MAATLMPTAVPPPHAPRRWVMLASEAYALPILRPLAACAQARGHQVLWLAPDAVAARLQPGEQRIGSGWQLRAFKPHAVFATVNRIPPFFPGLQVQLFHGLNLHKRDPAQGQFRMLGLFDLYCSHGPATTAPLQQLATQRRDFGVVETGWPKLDALFAAPGTQVQALLAAAGGRPRVMYASTFNAPLSQASRCLPVLEALIARGDRYWLLTLHPMSPPAVRERYRALAGPNACYLEAEHVVAMMQAADVLVCDTSSVVEEFILLDKPVVTVCHRQPQPCMHDVRSPDEIDAAIDAALAMPGAAAQARRAYAMQIHPATDARAAERVLAAVEQRLCSGDAGLRRRARRPFRRWWRSWTLWRALLPGKRTTTPC
jgi:CDP-glycerol glycerophosphotransferase (TagB/SpsB family)